MLLERESELAAVAQSLHPDSRKREGAIVFCGEPGVGKSVLLAAAAAAAPGRVLSARGIETENELPFVGLRDILAPVLPLLADLPGPQRRALLGALAIEDTGPVEPFALRVATLTLLSIVAQGAPLLVVVDDVQWLDAASADVLRFVAPRISHEPIVLLMAAREPPYGFDAEAVEVRNVQRLSRNGVRALTAERGAWPDPAAVADALHDATGGNPLAVGELLEQGTDRLTNAIRLRQPLPITDVIGAGFQRRLDRLPDSARTALLVAAASETRDLELLTEAASGLGVGLDAFGAAESAETVTLEDGHLHFRHPIMRSVVYSDADPAARRAAHRALADAALARSQPDEAAWQDALATVLPDEDVAAGLDAAASRYERRSGHFAAARALQRAATLSPQSDARADRLHRAAESARRAGCSRWAYDLLDEAAAAARRPRMQAEIEFTRTLLLSWSGSASEARHRYEVLADRVSDTEPDCAALAYGYAAAQAIVEGEIAAARRDAQRGIEIVRAGRASAEASTVVMQALGTVMVLDGDPDGAEAVRTTARRLLATGELTGREYLVTALTWIEDYELADRLLEPRIAAVRDLGDVRALTAALEAEAALRFRVGAWRAAHAAAAESVRLAEESDQIVQLAYSLATLAIIQAGQGDPATMTSVERSRVLATDHGLAEIEQYLATAGGLFHVGQGNGAAALPHLLSAEAYARRAGQREPAVHQWSADLLDAAVLTGNQKLAQRVISELSHASRSVSRAWGHAVAARGAGMVASSYGEAFEQALACHERTVAPFERGRTHLWWGRRLRRDRQRVEARRQLDTAVDLFEELGAHPWVEATQRELRASGARRQAQPRVQRDELTPQERQVASMVIGGASNKEIAGRMYLSPKTIETHLSRVYRKLDVRSRQELTVRALEGDDVIANLLTA